MSYVFSDEWHHERDRLVGLGATIDPVTSDVLSRIGVDQGWRCAEVDAGAGSMPAVIGAGTLTNVQSAAALAHCSDPAFAAMPAAIVSTWGRTTRPGG
jgi:hypothetical protein